MQEIKLVSSFKISTFSNNCTDTEGRQIVSSMRENLSNGVLFLFLSVLIITRKLKGQSKCDDSCDSEEDIYQIREYMKVQK